MMTICKRGRRLCLILSLALILSTALAENTADEINAMAASGEALPPQDETAAGVIDIPAAPGQSAPISADAVQTTVPAADGSVDGSPIPVSPEEISTEMPFDANTDSSAEDSLSSTPAPEPTQNPTAEPTLEPTPTLGANPTPELPSEPVSDPEEGSTDKPEADQTADPETGDGQVASSELAIVVEGATLNAEGIWELNAAPEPADIVFSWKPVEYATSYGWKICDAQGLAVLSGQGADFRFVWKNGNQSGRFEVCVRAFAGEVVLDEGRLTLECVQSTARDEQKPSGGKKTVRRRIWRRETFCEQFRRHAGVRAEFPRGPWSGVDIQPCFRNNEYANLWNCLAGSA